MRLFLRIFFSFWIATILMIALVVTVGEIWPLTFPEDRETRFQPEPVKEILTEAVNAYERQGASAMSLVLDSQAATRHRALDLFDQQGKILVGDVHPPLLYQQVARDVLESGGVEGQGSGFRTLFGCPIQSATGQHYAAVLTLSAPAFRRVRKLRFWFNQMIAMVPAAFVCMLLSLYLTRPITRLRKTAQRLAGGDLSARATTPGFLRRDELGDLARDFDIMAGQIQSLMTAQRRFVADVSHELGAPLTRMHLALALLRRQLADKDSVELARIERETDKLSNLVQQLLLLAGLEAGSPPAETFAPVSIRAFCESIIEDAGFEAAHANCRITGSRQDVTLLVYPQLLRRAIDNVLRNAIRYAPAGSEIQLNCRATDDAQQVILEVLDCGPGVPESMLSDIFRPFFRTAPGRESKSGGTGLGLAIASEAVRLHDGTIAACNRKEGGLQVTITLPLRAPTREQDLQHISSETGAV
jgi:two-component system, OmpR family, sensor histidine kinase CpxA